MRRALSDKELETLVHGYFRHVAYCQMAANKRIGEFYQLDNDASIDVGGLVKSLVRLIKEEKEKSKIEALEDALEFMGQFPDFNLANMYEYIKDKGRENIENGIQN